MKKALLLALALCFSAKFTFAQEGENELKNVRFGLMVNPQMTWYKPDSKKLTSGGAVAKIGGGLGVEFRLAKVASLSTGFMINMTGGKLNMVDTTYYFLSSEGEFQGRSDTTATSVQYKLNNRTYKNSYITLPLIMKLKTPEIGALTYYGQFGINTNIRWKSKVTDDVNAFNGNAHSTQTDINNAKDMQLFNFAINFGIGTEWNLAGTTSMVFSLSYNLGFTNSLKGDSEYLFRTPVNSSDAFKQAANANGVALTIGVLF